MDDEASFLCKRQNEWFKGYPRDFDLKGQSRETRSGVGRMTPYVGECPLCEEEHTVYLYERRSDSSEDD